VHQNAISISLLVISQVTLYLLLGWTKIENGNERKLKWFGKSEFIYDLDTAKQGKANPPDKHLLFLFSVLLLLLLTSSSRFNYRCLYFFYRTPSSDECSSWNAVDKTTHGTAVFILMYRLLFAFTSNRLNARSSFIQLIECRLPRFGINMTGRTIKN
jgi:hypothetical protein